MALSNHKKPEDAMVAQAADGLWLRLPDEIKVRLYRFLVDNSSGNVQLNIQEGQIRKLVIEEHIRG